MQDESNFFSKYLNVISIHSATLRHHRRGKIKTSHVAKKKERPWGKPRTK